ILLQLSESRREATARAELQQNVLVDIQSQLNAQNRMLKATNGLMLSSKQPEQETNKNGKRPK
ncbi:hypothetical protein BGZ76_005516, partial [Entomortierella beljakovae]